MLADRRTDRRTERQVSIHWSQYFTHIPGANYR